jgi:hypothetical protein
MRVSMVDLDQYISNTAINVKLSIKGLFCIGNSQGWSLLFHSNCIFAVIPT